MAQTHAGRRTSSREHAKFLVCAKRDKNGCITLRFLAFFSPLLICTKNGFPAKLTTTKATSFYSRTPILLPHGIRTRTRREGDPWNEVSPVRNDHKFQSSDDGAVLPISDWSNWKYGNFETIRLDIVYV